MLSNLAIPIFELSKEISIFLTQHEDTYVGLVSRKVVLEVLEAVIHCQAGMMYEPGSVCD